MERCFHLLSHVLVFLLGAVVASSTLAVDKEFIGTDGDWSEDNNWNPVELPIDDDEVMIGSGNVVTISDDVGTIRLFRIGGDIQLDEDGNAILREDDGGPQGDQRLVTSHPAREH